MIPEAVRATVIINARSYLGCEIQEEPAGSNRGFWIDMMQARFGGKPGWSWCMYCVQDIYYDAYLAQRMQSPLCFRLPNGDIDLSAANGHCYSVWQHALNQHELSTALADKIFSGFKIPRGAIYIRYNEDRTGHTGIVVSHWQDDSNHSNDIIKTIEGNASNAVREREYKLGELMSANLRGIIY
jgi:hypothetical protein